jgi:hypothetical protein
LGLKYCLKNTHPYTLSNFGLIQSEILRISSKAKKKQ